MSEAGEVYTIRTLPEAKRLALDLAATMPDAERASIGLTELLVNAVEHGNLGITYFEKADLLERGELDGEIDRRLGLPQLASRRVRVTVRRAPSAVTTTIEDEGEGFDWRPYLTPDPERLLAASGHGIAIACGVCFDEVSFQGRGNRVIAVTLLPG